MSNTLKKKKGYKIAKSTEKTFYQKQEILKEHNKPTYEKVEDSFEYFSSVALCQATGTGKSFIALQWLVNNLQDGQKAIYLAPSETIILQIKKHIKELGLTEKLKNVKFVLYQGLNAEVDAMLESSTNVDYIVADEFHRLGAPTWGRAYQRLLEANPEAKVLGLSATPVRYLDNERDMAEELFETRVDGISLVEAIKEKIIPTPTVVRGVISYSEQIDELKKKSKLIKDEKVRQKINNEISKIKRHIEQGQSLEELFGEHMTVKDGKYILFCRDLEHLEEIKEKIKSGMFAKVNPNVKIYDVSYQKTDKQVEKEIEKFENDNSDSLKIMLSVEMFNEGVHVEGVDGCIMMRKTLSPRIFLQQFGRALSVGTEKTPLIIDLVENYESIQSYKSCFFDQEYGYGYGELLEEVLPFEIKGEAVETDRLLDELDDLISSSIGINGWLALARAYCAKYGDLKVPHKYTNGKINPLYTWLSSRKQDYANDQEDPRWQWVFEELNKLDPKWHFDRSRGNENFQREMLERCRQYYAENHHLKVPAAHGSNRDLYNWLNSKRRSFLNNPNDLGFEWIYDELSSMDPEWYFDRSRGNEGYQREMLEKCKLYYSVHGNLLIPSKDKERKQNLLQLWLRCRRYDYEENPESPEKKWIFDELEKLDAEWYIDKSRGSEYFQKTKLEECRLYYNKNGNLNAPQRLQNGKLNPLNTWLIHRRKDYKNNPDDPEWKWIFDELSEIDSEWYMNSHDKKLNECRQYFAEHGNLIVPIRDENGKALSLYTWLSHRRREYDSEFNNPKKKWIFDELSRIDPEWKSDRRNGNENYQREMLEWCRKYHSENGILRISSKGENSNEDRLYGWLVKRRQGYLEDPQASNWKWVFDELSAIDPYWYLSQKEYIAKIQELENNDHENDDE